MAGVPHDQTQRWPLDPAIGAGGGAGRSRHHARVVRDAIKAGYRSIDTAEGYDNEAGVGEGIGSAGVPREELFITSKLRNGGHARDAALKSFDETMKALKLDLARHVPHPLAGAGTGQVRRGVEDADRTAAAGAYPPDRRVKPSIEDHLERIIGETGVVPV